MLRYTVFVGALFAIAGIAICFMAKRITMAKRKQDEIAKNDKLFVTLRIVGACLIIVGLIIAVLPISAGFYQA